MELFETTSFLRKMQNYTMCLNNFFLKPSDEKRTRSRLLIINFIYFIERNSTKSIYDLCIRFNFNTVDLFVCLGFLVLLENFFTHMETSPLLVKGCKFWPMLGISEDLWHSQLMPSVWQWNRSCFEDLGLSWLWFEHSTFCLRGERSNPPW